MSGPIVELNPIEVPLKLGPVDSTDADTFITCWTLQFMCMAVVLGLTDEQVVAIAELGEYLKLCLGVTTALKGGRRRRGGAGEDITTALANVVAAVPDDKKTKIKELQSKLVEARSKALGKFQKAPSMMTSILRLMASAGIALMPIADKLITLGLKLKAEQVKSAAMAAMVTAPLQMAAIAAGDATLTALNSVDAAFAGAGALAVEGTMAASSSITNTAGWFANTLKLIQTKPGTRAEAEKQAADRLVEASRTRENWAQADAAVEANAKYDAYFNTTVAPLLAQQPRITSGTDAENARSETEGAQIVKGIRATRKSGPEAVQVLAGFKNFVSPFNVYMFMFAHLFRDHTITYLNWSNTIALTIAGIVAEDLTTVVLCITWVMSAFVGVTWIARLLDALSTKLEVETNVKLLENSADAEELKLLLQDAQLAVATTNGNLARLVGDRSAGGRRSTSRRRRAAAYLPRRTRRSSSGRRQRYSRRRRE